MCLQYNHLFSCNTIKKKRQQNKYLCIKSIMWKVLEHCDSFKTRILAEVLVLHFRVWCDSLIRKATFLPKYSVAILRPPNTKSETFTWRFWPEQRTASLIEEQVSAYKETHMHKQLRKTDIVLIIYNKLHMYFNCKV